MAYLAQDRSRMQPPPRKRGSVLKRVASNIAEGVDGSDKRFISHDDYASRAGRSLYWEDLWQQTPWFDNDGPCVALMEYLGTCSGTALVPGCGRGHDCHALAERGFARVVGVDISPRAIDAARACRTSPAVEFIVANFFEIDGVFDFVLDSIFFASLHPHARRAWARHMARVVAPGGTLAVLVFPMARWWHLSQFYRHFFSGPPYNITVDLVKHLLAREGFAPVHVQDPLPPDLHHLPNNHLHADSAFLVLQKQPILAKSGDSSDSFGETDLGEVAGQV
ncbi:hypothetical protein CTAYLR_000047 [Chrysophaeum taylorii]|uniref:Uncharacterized protein n=1 Tax=Chrysophaeum taylorii TaxID=2483200 RepID=A0AAD7XK39_9STRA|nr:hypothetical protein CTAYLR_000047 [Chrysophaeum taylorii]